MPNASPRIPPWRDAMLWVVARSTGCGAAPPCHPGLDSRREHRDPGGETRPPRTSSSRQSCTTTRASRSRRNASSLPLCCACARKPAAGALPRGRGRPPPTGVGVRASEFGTVAHRAASFNFAKGPWRRDAQRDRRKLQDDRTIPTVTGLPRIGKLAVRHHAPRRLVCPKLSILPSPPPP